MSTPPPAAASGSNVLLIIGIIVGLLFPIGGLIIAIVLFVKGRSRHGLIVLGATIVGVLIGVLIFL